MARPKHDDPTRMVASEVIHATGLDKRALQHIRDRRAGPFEDQEAMRLAAEGFYSEDALAELAVSGAAHNAGFPLLQAVAVSRARFAETPDHRPAWFAMLDQFDAGKGFRPGPAELRHWLNVSELLHNATGGYVGGTHAPEDSILWIAEGRYVLEGKHKPRLRPLYPPGADTDLPEPVCRIIDMKDAKATVAHWSEDYPDVASAFAAYQEAMRRAVGVVRVNISLAIRNAFDRVHELRRTKGGPFFPEGGQ